MCWCFYTTFGLLITTLLRSWMDEGERKEIGPLSTRLLAESRLSYRNVEWPTLLVFHTFTPNWQTRWAQRAELPCDGTVMRQNLTDQQRDLWNCEAGHTNTLFLFFLSFFFSGGAATPTTNEKVHTNTHTHIQKTLLSLFFFRKMKWVNYQSNMYKYGLLFMCAAAVLALMNDGGGSKASWEWMNQQRELREQEKKRIQWRSHCQNRTEQSTCRVHSWSMNLPQCPSRSCNNPVDKKKERKKEAILTVWLLVRESSGSCSLQVLLLNTFFFLLAFSFFFFLTVRVLISYSLNVSILHSDNAHR